MDADVKTFLTAEAAEKIWFFLPGAGQMGYNAPF